MVYAHGPDPGVRLGDLHGIGLSTDCAECHHSARMRLALWGTRTRLREVARDLRCGRCGGRKVGVQGILDTRLPEARAADPDGAWKAGPNFPEIDAS